MSLPLKISDKDKILILAPHPDDECIGVGGLLCIYKKQCEVIVMTDGCRGGSKDILLETEGKIRKEQFENEMRYLEDVSYQWLGYEDGTLMQHNECMNEINFSKYTKIFLPTSDDNHSDHTATCLYAIEQLKKKGLSAIEVYQYEVHVPSHDVSHYLDITDAIYEKMKLIRFHKDQVHSVPYDNIAYSLAKYRACKENKSDNYLETYYRTNIFEYSVENTYSEREKILQKYKQFYTLLLQWIEKKQQGCELFNYFLGKGIHTIAIYGFSDLGRAVYHDLEKSSVVVKYAMDKRPINNVVEKLPVFVPKTENPDVDAVIVTAISYFDEIRKELCDLGYKNVFSFQNILEEMR